MRKVDSAAAVAAVAVISSNAVSNWMKNDILWQAWMNEVIQWVSGQVVLKRNSNKQCVRRREQKKIMYTWISLTTSGYDDSVMRCEKCIVKD